MLEFYGVESAMLKQFPNLDANERADLLAKYVQKIGAQMVRIGLYVEDGAIQMRSEAGIQFEVHVFDKDTYDTATDEDREEMEKEREIVEAMHELFYEVERL